MIQAISLSEILKLFPDSRREGTTCFTEIRGIASLDASKPGDLSFLGNLKYRLQVKDSKASVIFLPENYTGLPHNDQLFIYMHDPSVGITEICKLIEKKHKASLNDGVHPRAFVDETAKIPPSVSVGPFSFVDENVEIGAESIIESHCHIGKNVKIGKRCRVYPGVKILAFCELMDGVVLNAGAVIGSEGFGFNQVGEAHNKIPHLGKVVIENDVEIGANACVDRARFEETRIGEMTKIDNLVQIGHNVKIGKGWLIVAQVGISGSVTMEDNVVVGGQAGFSGHIRVGKNSKIAGQAGITKNVEPGAYLKGNPAIPVQLAHRISILQRKLPELFDRFSHIEERM